MNFVDNDDYEFTDEDVEMAVELGELVAAADNEEAVQYLESLFQGE